MRLWIISDLHLDVNEHLPFILPHPRPEHDVVVIAGDICEGAVRGVKWIAQRRLNEKPVIYVPGNHEFYNRDIVQELTEARIEAAKHANIYVLNRDAQQIGGVLFLGAILWTDYKLFGEDQMYLCRLTASRTLNDHDRIGNGTQRWSVGAAANDHADSREWLAAQLETEFDRTVVIVTHHAPSILSVAPRYKDDILSAAFASNCEDLASRADLWVHGHVHHRVDYKLNSCRVVGNPRGYVGWGESELFDPEFCAEVSPEES
jgi:predicted phosphodiesterase